MIFHNDAFHDPVFEYNIQMWIFEYNGQIKKFKTSK